MKTIAWTINNEKNYHYLISKRVEISYKDKRNLIFTFDGAMDELAISKTKGNLTANLMAYLKYAQEGLKASQSSSQLLEFFSTEEGEQKYNLNNPISCLLRKSLFLTVASWNITSHIIQTIS